MEPQLQTHEPSFIDAVLRVIEASQRLVLDRVDLARLDVARLATYALRGAVLVAVGAVLIAGAWFATEPPAWARPARRWPAHPRS